MNRVHALCIALILALSGCVESTLPELKNANFSATPYGDQAIEVTIRWTGKGEFLGYIQVEDLNDPIQSKNYETIRSSWTSIISSALENFEALPNEYQNDEFSFDPKTGYFMLPIPTEPIEANTEWFIGYESEPAWVVDFEGFVCTGGQGLF